MRLTPVQKRWCARVAVLLFIAVIVLGIEALQRAARVRHGGAALDIGGAAERLAIITPHWEGIRVEFARAFNAWRQARGQAPVRFEWLDVGGTSDIMRYLRSAYATMPRGINIDMLFGGGMDPFLALDAEGLLERTPVPAAILSNIPAHVHGVPLYDPRGAWYGAALSGFGILYNNVVHRKFGLPVPVTWEDLSRPPLRTWVGSADPRKSGSVHMMYEIMLQAYGWEKGMQIIAALCGNVRGFSQSASTVPRDVALGEIACGLCIDLYAWSTIEEVGGNRLGFVLPQGLTVVNPDAIAVLKGAPNAALAREFLAFVLTEEGQKIWMLRTNCLPGAPVEFALNKMPVWPALYAKYRTHTVFTDSPFAWTNVVRFDAAKSMTRNAILNDYLGALYIDAHRECAAAWAQVAALPADDAARLLYLQQPLSEAAMLTAATSTYLNAAWRTRAMTDWANDARARYAIIARRPRHRAP